MSILVSNIPDEIGFEVLTEEFSVFGDIKLNYFGRFAYIEYKDLKSARNAVLSWNGRIMAGHLLKIEYHYEQPTQIEHSLPDTNEKSSIKDQCQESQKDPEKDSSHQLDIISQVTNSQNQNNKAFREAGEIEENDSESVEIPKTSSKSKRFIEDVCDALIEANPTIFKIKRTNKKKPKSSLITCEICCKDFKKSSIRQHITSKSHQSKLT